MSSRPATRRTAPLITKRRNRSLERIGGKEEDLGDTLILEHPLAEVLEPVGVFCERIGAFRQ